MLLEESCLGEDVFELVVVGCEDEFLAVALLLAYEEVFVVGDGGWQLVVLCVPSDAAGTVGDGEEFESFSGDDHLYEVLAFFLTFFFFDLEVAPVVVVEEESAEELFGGQSFVGGFACELGGEVFGEGLQGANASFVEDVHLAHLVGSGLGERLRRGGGGEGDEEQGGDGGGPEEAAEGAVWRDYE